MKRLALGRGLDALIPSTDLELEKKNHIMEKSFIYIEVWNLQLVLIIQFKYYKLIQVYTFY